MGIRCDHREDADVLTAFARITQETPGIDILVNNVWGGYERMIDNGAFTWTRNRTGGASRRGHARRT